MCQAIGQPICSRAASLIIFGAHGGSQTRSTSTGSASEVSSPSVACTSSITTPAIGQAGDVIVIVTTMRASVRSMR